MRVNTNGLAHRFQAWFFDYYGDSNPVHWETLAYWWRHQPRNKCDFWLKMVIAIVLGPFKAAWFAFWCTIVLSIVVLIGKMPTKVTLLSVSKIDFQNERTPIYRAETLKFYLWEFVAILLVSMGAMRYFPDWYGGGTIGLWVIGTALYIGITSLAHFLAETIIAKRETCERVEYHEGGQRQHQQQYES